MRKTAILLALIFTSCAIFKPQFKPGPKLVIPWVVNHDSLSFISFKKHSALISIVSPVWLKMDSLGKIHANIDSNLLNFARRNKIPIMPLISNYGFKTSVAESLLSRPEIREQAADSILKFILDGNFIGVNLDFEGPFVNVREGYTKFVELVSAKLHNYGKIVTVDVVSKTKEKYTGWAGVYNYRELGEVVDYFIIMGYDYTSRLDPPGPIAPRWWVEKTIQFAMQNKIPPDKIILGIPFYGRLWKENQTGRGLYYPQIQEIINKYKPKIKWDKKAETPYAEFIDENNLKNVLYFENEKSLSKKIDLVLKYNLAGIAIWRLDGEPEKFWKIIELKLKPKPPIAEK